MRLGLIGCGSIGGTVADSVSRGDLPGIELIGAVDAKPVETLGCTVWPDVAHLLDSHPDLVLEAASADAVRGCAAAVLDSGADLMVVSVGAFADMDLLDRLVDLARQKHRQLYVPSGAIGGIDIIKAASMDGLEECSLTTTKPPKSFNNVAYVREQGFDLDGMQQATILFDGTARRAAGLFPQNLNVAVAISLAGLGVDRTTVKIVADPASVHNVHEVFVRGKFGEASVRLVNRPSPRNPKSSYLTGLSVIATLRRISRQFQLGT